MGAHLALVAVDQHRVIALVEDRSQRRDDLVIRDCARVSQQAVPCGVRLDKSLLDTKGSLLPGIPNWKSLRELSQAVSGEPGELSGDCTH